MVTTQYYKACLLGRLKDLPSFRSAVNLQDVDGCGAERMEQEDEKIVYINENFHVVEGPAPDARVLFDVVTAEWRIFCTEQLEFEPY